MVTNLERNHAVKVVPAGPNDGREPIFDRRRPSRMKTRYLSLLVVALLLLAACGGSAATSAAPSGGSLGMCAEGVTDCVDVIVDDGAAQGDDVAVPTGNAVNPQPVTDAVLDGISPEGRELRFKLWMGVEPCDVIHSVNVIETGTTVDVEIMRGVGDIAATCIAMAVERTVVVDLEAPLGDRAVTLSGVELAA